MRGERSGCAVVISSGKEPQFGGAAQIESCGVGQASGGNSFQLLPLSVLYSQAPSVEIAALAVMATPRKVSLSSSEKELPKRLATVSPAGLVESSVTAAREGLPLAEGALLES